MDEFINHRADYDYHIEEDSDIDINDGALSSEDEFNREFEDSFEQIMENEVNMVHEGIQQQSSNAKPNLKEGDYFHMDDELYMGAGNASGSKKGSGSGSAEMTNDDLLYDPDLDEENERWIENERQRYRVRTGNKSTNNEKNKKSNEMPKHKSDAILSCPACMTTVCIDCQRHDVYKTQYRAMFVMNCDICRDELLRYETKNKSRKRRNKEGPGKLIAASSEDRESELYNPVKCTECQTVIAVFDIDEIYHFFNVLASQA